MSYYIESLSGGKDSLADFLLRLENGLQTDEVVFYDTGKEFQAIYNIQNKVKIICEKQNIKYTVLHPELDFDYKMFDKPVNGTKNGFHYGYSWCGGRCRWGTTDKIKALDTYAKAKKATVCVGIAHDEQKRLIKLPDWKCSTIAEYKMTEVDCLQYCYDRGWNWLEGDIELYNILDRVSCWCCSNKNLKELKNIYLYLPEYWEKLKVMQSRLTRPMKGYYKGNPVGIFELDERFKLEEKQNNFT